LSPGHILNAIRAPGAGTHEAVQAIGTPNGAGAGTHAAVQATAAPHGPGAGTHAAAQGI
jgi:hypothetical protein